MRDMGDAVLWVYSSRTGNTKKLVEGARQKMGIAIPLQSIDTSIDVDVYTCFLVGFWVDRGTADVKTLEFLKRLEGKSIGLVGTLGAYPDSPHAKEVESRLRLLVSEKNHYLGCFLAQGKIDPALTEHFKKLPPDHPHAMTEERKKRHEEAAKHPNENDMERCAKACLEMIRRFRGRK